MDENKDGAIDFKVLQDKLTEASSAVSSANTGLEESISKAIAGARAAGAATKEATTESYNRQIAAATAGGAVDIQGFQEEQRGFGTIIPALREVTKTIDSNLNDLRSRKAEALANADAKTAEIVSGLEMKALEMRQKIAQDQFTNLTKLTELSLSEQAQRTQQKQFADQLSQSKYEFDKNLGIKMKELDISRQGLELERERNQISRSEYNLRLKQYEHENNTIMFDSFVSSKVKTLMSSGVNPNDIDAGEISISVLADMAALGVKATPEQINSLTSSSHKMISDASKKYTEAAPMAIGEGGLFTRGAAQIGEAGVQFFDWFLGEGTIKR